jgi:hypothetical protein
MNNVPDQMNFQGGLTYVTWITAPIPRSVWSKKPSVHVGDKVATEIWGRSPRAGGIPPGLVGEAYINFGWAGVLLVPFLLGVLIKTVYIYTHLFTSNKNVIIYAIFCGYFIIGIVSHDLSGAVVNFLKISVPSSLIMVFSRW